MHQRQVIIRTAFISRLILTLIQYVANQLIPDHDADAFRYPKSNTTGFFDNAVTHFLGGFIRWDAQYFMHIAIYGYSYEHILAFFPLCPVLVKHIVLVLSYVIPFLNLDSLTLLVFLAVNLFCFVSSALVLYDLSTLIVGNNVAFKASVLFCFNPASVFFTAPYTECVFSYLSFKSMLNCVLLYRKYRDGSVLQVKDVVYIIPICLGTCTRSNGILNVGFLIYAFICLMLDRKRFQLVSALRFLLLTLVSVAICMIPFIAFQMYSYLMFCDDFETNLPASVLEHRNVEQFVLSGTFSQHNQSWCYKKIPLAYSYIQSHYWNVGFLQYYEVKQIPNFILAFPIVFILLHGAFIFFKQFPKRLAIVFNFHLIGKRCDATKFNPVILVFVIHSTALTLFCILNMHVQVATRMLCSSSPILYWFAAFDISSLSKCNSIRRLIDKQYSFREFLVIAYFLSYYVLGTVMFCNFLPWT